MDEGRKTGITGRDLGRPQTLSVGEHQTIPAAAFNHRGCCDLCWADHAEDWCRVAHPAI